MKNDVSDVLESRREQALSLVVGMQKNIRAFVFRARYSTMKRTPSR